MFRMIPTGLALAVLLGCASKPAPMAPAEFYEYFGSGIGLINLCSSKGFMDSAQAGKGMFVLKQQANKSPYRYSPAEVEKIRKGVEETYVDKINPPACNQLAAQIETDYLEISKPQPVIQQSPSTLTNTNCTTYFGNTNCISY